MRLPLIAAVAVVALGCASAAPAFAKSGGAPKCAPGDPVVTVYMTSKTYVIDRPLAPEPMASGGHLVSPMPESSSMAMASPEAMGSPMAMASPMASSMAMGGAMQKMCESKAGMAGFNPAGGTPPSQQ